MTLPQTPPARICAIVVTFNRLEKFRRTVERLLAEPLDQVLVIENGSTDGTREWLRSDEIALQDPRLLVLEQAENGGGAQGFETGMREARNRFDPDWYLVMDDDARPMPGATQAFRATLPRPEGAVLAAVATLPRELPAALHLAADMVRFQLLQR